MSSATLLLPAIYAWLIRSVCVSSALLCCGYLVARLLREPADRLRVLQWTVGVTLASLILVALPANWKWTIPVITRSHDTNPQPITPTGLAPSELTIDRPLRPDLQTKVSPAATTSTAQAQVVGSNQGDLIPAPTVSTSMPIASAIDWPRMWMQCLVGTYCACCLFIVLRLVVAQLWLWRTLKHSVEVPPEIETQFHRIAGARAASVRLRLSNDVTTPVTWGLKSPVILLPTAILNDERPSTVQYCLAHEWSHVHRRDSWTWQFVVCLHAFLFYNPLYWLCRRSLLVTMDQLADSEAARLGDSPLDYAEFLVQLARHRQRPVPTLALGVADKHSQLRQRIEYLVANSGVTTMFCSPMRSLAIGTLAVVIGMAGSVVRFERRLIADDQPQEQSKPSTTEKVPDNVSASNADTPNQHPEPEAPAPTDGLLKMFTDLAKPQISEMLKVASRKQADGSIVYTGFVTDASNDLPISGAKIKVHRKLSRDPKTGGWSVLEVTEHTSNAVGMYSFRLSPEQVEQPSLYIEVEAKHPNYASYSRAGYSHHMIVKNLEVGELPFYTNLALWPGQPIEGTVMSPDGKVVPDAEVVIYATSAKAARFRGGWERTSTDADGRFRVVAPSPGDGVLWIKRRNTRRKPYESATDVETGERFRSLTALSSKDESQMSTESQSWV